MRIAYFGGDWFAGCISALQENGHIISHLFTDGEQYYNSQIRQWAKEEQVKVYTHKPSSAQMQRLLNEQVDLLFCVEFPWKIPCASMPFKTINVHPSLLPYGRGANPISWSILRYPEHAGISLHKLAEQFDRGDIVYQRAIKLEPTTDLDDYLLLLETEIPQMVRHLCENFDSLYDNAQIQTEGSYWPKFTLNDRKINWQMSVLEIDAIVRASGQFGIVAIIEDQIYLVKGVTCQSGVLAYPPGTIFNEDKNCYSIAVKNGQCIVPKAGIIEAIKLES